MPVRPRNHGAQSALRAKGDNATYYTPRLPNPVVSGIASAFDVRPLIVSRSNSAVAMRRSWEHVGYHLLWAMRDIEVEPKSRRSRERDAA